jgi:hypothetical protein
MAPFVSSLKHERRLCRDNHVYDILERDDVRYVYMDTTRLPAAPPLATRRPLSFTVRSVVEDFFLLCRHAGRCTGARGVFPRSGINTSYYATTTDRLVDDFFSKISPFGHLFYFILTESLAVVKNEASIIFSKSLADVS